MEPSTVKVQVLSRRVVRPEPAPSPDGAVPSEPKTAMHLTSWDLRMLTVDYIQKGHLLPKPHTGAESLSLLNGLASSFARALARFYPLAGRIAVTEAATGIVVSLCCSGEGAEFVHAVAPEVTAIDIAAADYYIPPVVWSLFPLNGALGADVSCPVLAARLEDFVRRPVYPPVRECFFHFS
nr:unnamed protein product [Digitaria exilis]